MPLDLPDHRDRCKGRETDLAGWIESVDSVNQPQHGDLREVVQRFASAPETPCQVSGKRRVQLHELFPSALIRQPLEEFVRLLLSDRGGVIAQPDTR